MEACVFCKIISGEAEATKVYEDADIMAFLDIQPVNSGHILIVPKQHSELVADMDVDLVSRMFQLAQKLNSAIRASTLRCEGVNYFLADGEVAGQEVPHVHLHVIPRFKGDGFGLKFPAGYGDRPSREVLESVGTELRDCFTNLDAS